MKVPFPKRNLLYIRFMFAFRFLFDERTKQEITILGGCNEITENFLIQY